LNVVIVTMVTLYNELYVTVVLIIEYNLTDPGSFKLTDISYRLRFSFVSFACIVRSFLFSVRLRFVRVIGSFVSCIVRFVRQLN